jgi:hypothetical protein
LKIAIKNTKINSICFTARKKAFFYFYLKTLSSCCKTLASKKSATIDKELTAAPCPDKRCVHLPLFKYHILIPLASLPLASLPGDKSAKQRTEPACPCKTSAKTPLFTSQR